MFLDHVIIPILLVLRNDADLECRRLSLDALLSLLSNRTFNFTRKPRTRNSRKALLYTGEVQKKVRNDDEVVNTILALSKFGISSEVKERASKIIVSFAQISKSPFASFGTQCARFLTFIMLQQKR